MRIGITTTAVLVLVCYLTSGAPAAPPANAVIDAAKAEGRPPGADEKLKRPRYFLWHDAEGWHLHSRTGGKGHEFAGTVRVAGGKIYELRGIGGLEKKKDFGAINSAGNAVQFKFRTSAPGDGLDFKVSADVTRLDFDLKLDGYGHAQQIGIGAKGERPESATFTIELKPKTE
jgi:hypothetical protein